mgnify:CR=1 FL=1
MNQELLDQVKAKMQEYVDQEIPILKRSISTDDAIERFHKHRMYDKERLFLYAVYPESMFTVLTGLRTIFTDIWFQIEIHPLFRFKAV